MASLDDLKNLPTPPPSGWQPGVEWDGDTGHVTVFAPHDEPTVEEVRPLIEAARLDPDTIDVDWTKSTRITLHTDANGDMIQAWYKLPLQRKPERTFDVEDLLDAIYLDDVEAPDYTEPLWRTVQIGDCHLGKGYVDGGGSEHIAEKWKRSVEAALDCGYRDGVHLAFLGDLIEGQVSQGGQNIAGNDLTLTEQLRVARHLVLWTIQRALEVAPRVIVSATPGNHGESTRVQNRPMTDSYDLDIVNAVQQAIELTELDGFVEFYYPREGDGHVTYSVGDTVFTCAHGHKFGGKLNGAERWWSGMAVNGREPGAAHILLAGHFHSMQVANFTRDKWIMFGPSLERESNWFAQKNGSTSRAGVLAFDTDSGTPLNIGVV